MSKQRPTITARMKVDSLLHRIMLQFGRPLLDFEGNELRPGDPVVFDHPHGLTFEGPHVHENLRPCLKSANDAKAKKETRDYHHVRRLREGKTKSAPPASSRFPAQSRAIPSSRVGRST